MKTDLSLKIDFDPRVAQYIILDALDKYRFVTAICHRRLGKTSLAIYWLIISALTSTQADGRYYYFGVSQKSAKLVSWAFFKKLLAPLTLLNTKNHKYVIFRESELQIHFWNGSVIALAGSENIESYRGIYADCLVCDELASWTNPKYAYTEVLRPALSDRNGKALFIGTVKGLDLLYELYMKDTSNWHGIKLPASITNILPPSELKDLQDTLSPAGYERELECNFFSANPDTLISSELIKTAQQRPPLEYQSEYPIIFGLDVGRTGDPSVLFMRQGLNATHLKTFYEPSGTILATLIIPYIKQYSPTTIFIDVGQGYSVIDSLDAHNFSHIVQPVHFNQTSPLPSCFNMRSYMYFQIKQFLEKGTIPDIPELLKELSNQELIDDPDNRVRLAPKTKIKKRIGHSPDHSDALALTFTEPDTFLTPEEEKKAATERFLKTQNIIITQTQTYDPLSYMENYYDNDANITGNTQNINI